MNELGERVHGDLKNLVHWMGANSKMSGWRMQPDELEGECWLAVARCLDRYGKSIEYPELLRACRQSMKFAVIDASRLSGRETEMYLEDALDTQGEESWDESIPDDLIYTPELHLEAMELVTSLSGSLSDTDRDVLDAILGKNKRVPIYLDLWIKRSRAAFSGRSVSTNIYVISRALCLSEWTIRRSLRRIKASSEAHRGRRRNGSDRPCIEGV